MSEKLEFKMNYEFIDSTITAHTVVYERLKSIPKIKSPVDIRRVTITKDQRIFSSFRMRAKNRINNIEVDLTIVYNGTVINTNDQFDRPISSAEIRPVYKFKISLWLFYYRILPE